MLLCMVKHEHPPLEDSEEIASDESTISSNTHNRQGRSVCSSNHSMSVSSLSRPLPTTITATTNTDTIPTIEETTTTTSEAESYSSIKSESNPRLILTASIRSSYEYECDNIKQLIPTISYNELILPGSEAQKQMAFSMKDILCSEAGGGCNSSISKDECVICMEEFTDDNPRMVRKNIKYHF